MPKFELSIVLRSVDRATAGLRNIARRFRGINEPLARMRLQLRGLRRDPGIRFLGAGLRGASRAARSVGVGIAAIAASAGVAVAALDRITAAGDRLAKQADRIGVSVDSLAQLRFAAGQSGVATEALDSAMLQLSRTMGQLQAGQGRLNTLLNRVSPSLKRQLVAAGDAGEGLEILAKAMSEIESPARRAALANAAFGGSGLQLLTLLRGGPEAIGELRKEYADLAGPQEKAARLSEQVQDAFGRVKASFSGAAAAIIEGVTPAVLELSDKLGKFLRENRARITDWVRAFGERLPGAIAALSQKFSDAIAVVRRVWSAIGGLRGAAIALGTVIAGSLLGAVTTLFSTLLANPIGIILVGIAAWIKAGKELVQNWHLVTDFFGEIWGDIVGIFEDAWDRIKEIIDNVIEAPRRIYNSIGEYLGGGSGESDDIAAARRAAFASAGAGLPIPRRGSQTIQSTQNARVTIDIAGAPRGARARVERDSDADVDLSMGYAIGGT